MSIHPVGHRARREKLHAGTRGRGGPPARVVDFHTHLKVLVSDEFVPMGTVLNPNRARFPGNFRKRAHFQKTHTCGAVSRPRRCAVLLSLSESAQLTNSPTQVGLSKMTHPVTCVFCRWTGACAAAVGCRDACGARGWCFTHTLNIQTDRQLCSTAPPCRPARSAGEPHT